MRQAIDLIEGKNISRAKILLKVDGEFLRRALPMQAISGHSLSGHGRSSSPDPVDFKILYTESVDAMKMLSQQRKGQVTGLMTHGSAFSGGAVDDLNDLMSFNEHDSKSSMAAGRSSPYNPGGYKSNEIDEGSELNKLTALNVIACHQGLIESIETTQLKLQQLGLQ